MRATWVRLVEQWAWRALRGPDDLCLLRNKVDMVTERQVRLFRFLCSQRKGSSPTTLIWQVTIVSYKMAAGLRTPLRERHRASPFRTILCDESHECVGARATHTHTQRTTHAAPLASAHR